MRSDASSGRVRTLSASFALLLILALLLSACGAPEPAETPLDPTVPVAAPAGDADPTVPVTAPAVVLSDYTPEFDPAECPFADEIDLGGEPVECGYLLVPEDRSRADSPTIALAVAILPSLSDNAAPDPIIYLAGGPGGSALTDVEGWLDSPLREQRALILLDQRGMGYSAPSLNCPEVEAASDDTEELIAAYAACRDRLLDAGVDLAAYNSAASAADVADLRIALGYPQVNLLGISYGTRLALTIMRDHPTGIRSVILDSVYPPHVQGFEEQALNGAQAIRALFAGCAADPDCAAAYPALEQVFYDLVDQLNADPLFVTLEDAETGESEELEVDGNFLVNKLFGWLYDTEAIPVLPFLIAQLAEGDDTTLVEWLQIDAGMGASRHGRDDGAEEGDISDSEGAFYSVECREEMIFNDLDAAWAAAEALPPQLRDALIADVERDFAICEIWGAGEADALENQPVRSMLPTLVLAGEYDPITPPRWGEMAAQYLPNSFFFVAPGAGHSVIDAGECPLSIALAFLDNPTRRPAASCLAAMGPVFELP